MTATAVTDYLSNADQNLRAVGLKMQEIIDLALPGTHSALYHGHPVWSLGEKSGKNPICLLKTYSSYVTFGFWRGQEINDASTRLTPGARQMASVKLRSIEDIDMLTFSDWLTQAFDIERNQS
jgi:hypothetical protein